MKKGGQVTIFVIVGVVLVVAVLALFFFQSRPSVDVSSSNPRLFMTSCVESVLQPHISRLVDNGGVMSPSLSVNYSFDPSVGQRPYNYLCHTGDFFKTCYNLQPLVRLTAQRELSVAVASDLEGCFSSLQSDLQSEGFDTSGEFVNYSLSILPGQIEVFLDAPLTYSRGSSSQSIDSFTSKVISPLYSLLDLAEKVTAAESTYCYFDYNSYMVLFPQFNIRRIDFDGSKIYHLIDRPSGMTFKFAVRSCAFPLR